MSHRTRGNEPLGLSLASTYGQLSQAPRATRQPADKVSTTNQRLSMASNGSAGRRSSTSPDRLFSSGPARPSGIPRPSKTPSGTRLNTLTSTSTSRLPALPVYRSRTPSNITGVATRVVPQNRSVHRIIPSNNTPRIVSDDDLLSLEPPLPSLDMDHDTVLGIALPQKQLPKSTNLPPRLIPELQALAATSYRRPTPAMSTTSTISSPSTQFTTSPSPWSASTATTTPTSWSSTSPSLVQSAGPSSTSKRSQTVPIPTSTRIKMPKLPVLRENVNNSASSSKANLQNEDPVFSRKTKKKTPINSPAPTPPPRTSSVKKNRSRSNSNADDQKSPFTNVAPPLPREQDMSPIVRHVDQTASRSQLQPQGQYLTDNHQKLQEAINFIPPRPSRDGIENLDVRKPILLNSSPTKYQDQSRKLLDAAPIGSLPPSTSQVSLQSTRSTEPETSNVVPVPRSRLGKFSKFNLFARSPKKTSVDAEPQPTKLQRRGPTAGTGHEGYGRFGRRERRTSTDGNSTGTESETSVVSTRSKLSRSISRKERSSSSRRDRSSQSDLDDFVASRLKPVVILGGSQKMIKGSASLPSKVARPSSAIKSTNDTLSAPDEDRHTSIISSGPLMRESRLIFHLDSLDANNPSRLTSRESPRLNQAESLPMPPPINAAFNSSQPYLSSCNTSQSSLAPASAAVAGTASGLYKVDSQLLEKQRKKNRKLNWGFFRKKDLEPSTYQPRVSSRIEAPKMAVAVATIPPARPMPYYAMLDSENEVSHTEAIGDYLSEAAHAMSSYEEDDVVSPISNVDSDYFERAGSILLPSAPQIKQHNVSAQTTEAAYHSAMPRSTSTVPIQAAEKPRQPRLAQVGRIPKVIPTTQTANQVTSSPSQLLQCDTAADPRDLDNNKELSYYTTRHAVPGHQYPPSGEEIGKRFHIPYRMEKEQTEPKNQILGKSFFRQPDRYSTTSSSSDGIMSVMGPPLVPAPEFPTRNIRFTTTEDDIWNEYDEFIDRVISSPRLKKSKTRITDVNRTLPEPIPQSEALSAYPRSSSKNPKALAVNTSLALPPLFYSSPISIGDHDMDADFQLRRSRILSALHSSMDPSSPFSVGDYLIEPGEPRRNSGMTATRLSDLIMGQGGLHSPAMMFGFPEPPTTQAEYHHYQNAAHMDELERSKDPVKHSERSYASLMVSRWLSFGRVLFSPAHVDVQKQPERHVLVIDGLGNEDWSIYCAVTYQAEQALIYDLKETGHTRNATSPNKAGNTPQNLRRREMASFNEVFKFPDNFFSVIVLRFPPVMAESKLRNIISECRRVLAPGGYMELMLLDLDIVNMGVSTRRAMRDLKTNIAMRNREVSLKPVIDNVQSVLGEKGFSKLSRCVVGVPVVGKPADAESTSSSRSSGGSDRKSPSVGPRPLDGLSSRHHHNFSLNDLVADYSDNADAKIGRVVSRTARSWWQHCFEAAVISDGNLDKSIFADKHVLSECKSRASSFKLLIAYTQKPAGPAFGSKRRTMSEPVIATLATAGN